MTITMRAAVVAGAAAAAGAAFLPSAAQAATTFNQPVAYVQGGAIYATRGGGAPHRLTEDSVSARPRWSPDHTRIAYLHNGTAWVMNADGSGKRQVSDRAAGGPAWSPDGKWIAFSAVSCTGGQGVFRSSSTATAPKPEPLFPLSCRGVAVPEMGAVMTTGGKGNLIENLHGDNAVAWSPDGKKIAFRNGECDAIVDDCLSVGNVATGQEAVVASFGGGGDERSGFAVLPAWRPDGRKLSWTTFVTDQQPLHVVEGNADGSGVRTIGTTGEREMVYGKANKALLTAQYQGRPWVMLIDLTTGKHTPLHPGSQPTL